jgi:ribosomal protein S27AE
MSEDNPLDFLVTSPSGKLMEEGPIFKGDDIFQKDIKCPHCGYFIAQKIKYEKIKSILNFCPKCGKPYQHSE